MRAPIYPLLTAHSNLILYRSRLCASSPASHGLLGSQRQVVSAQSTSEKQVEHLTHPSKGGKTSSKARFLPEVVLKKILEVAYNMVPPHSAFSVHMSHVSRHFRKVAHATPFIWTFISNSQHREEVVDRLSRSTVLGLTISMNEGYGAKLLLPSRPTCEEFLRLVILESARWQRFRFGANKAPCRDMSGLEILAMNLRLPLLDSLYIDGGFPDSESHGALKDHFMKSWEMPLLREMMARNVTLEHFDSTPLMTMELTLATGRRYGWNFSASLLMLGRQTCMESLTLKLENISSVSVDIGMVALPNLRKLSIRLRRGVSTKTLRSIFSKLVLPKLEDLDLELQTHLGQTVTSLLKNMPLEADWCPLLRRLSLQTYSYRTDWKALQRIFNSFPQIEHLLLQTPTLAISDKAELKLPALRTLSLRHCDMFTLATVEKIAGHIMRDPAGTSLEDLQVAECRRIKPPISGLHELQRRLDAGSQIRG